MGLFSKKKRNAALVVSGQEFNELCIEGYAPLSKCPEVQAAANYVAGQIASMTIYLMRNEKNGDVRQRNALSKKIDIDPYSLGTRQTWMHNIVRNLMIGDGNQIVLPVTTNGYLDDLIPLQPSATTIMPNGNSYVISYKGRNFSPDEVLHFVLNPDPERPYMGMGNRAALRDVVNNLAQAAKTKKGFMSSKWKPSVIIKVDGLVDAFSSPEGREKLMNEYIANNEAGRPWMIPADQFQVEQVKPLSLNDLAINDAVKLDKMTVASIMGVPAYVLGAGAFNVLEHRAFITTRIMPIAQMIAQELTKKLLQSPDLYFTFNSKSLYSYDIKELADVGESLYTKGLATGNEVRGWLNMPPKQELNDLVMLENYIPASEIGNQAKLKKQEE